MLGLTVQQLERLLHQLKPNVESTSGTQQGGPSANMAGNFRFREPWVVDFGATEHITCDERQLTEICASNKRPVRIPNGARVPVKGTGKATLPNGIQVNDVLHIPDILMQFTFC